MLALFFALVAVASATFSRHVYSHFWTAGTSNSFPDALVTVDYSLGSSTFGQVIHTAPISSGANRKLWGNAPHHIGKSGSQRWIVGGGLLSFFVVVPTSPTPTVVNQGNKDDVFLFSVDSNMIPTFHSSYNLPGGCTDEFHADSPWSWIVSQMCDDFGNNWPAGANGAPQGGLYRFQVPPCSQSWCSASWTQWNTGNNQAGASVTLSGFNPHGGDYDAHHGFIISDFVWPASLLNKATKDFLGSLGDVVNPLTFRGTVNHFDTDGNLKASFQAPKGLFSYSGSLGTFTNAPVDVGLMVAKFFPGTRGRYAFVSGTFADNHLFLIDTVGGSVTPVFDWAANFAGVILSVGLPYINDEHRAIVQAVGMRHLGLINYAMVNGVPSNFVFKAGIDFLSGTQCSTNCAGPADGAAPQFPLGGYPGTHYIAVDDTFLSSPRVIVINSFVDFPVNYGGYICASPSFSPFGVDLLACPSDATAGNFMYNFHGWRTAHSVNIGNDWTTLSLDTSFYPNLGGRTPHSATLTDKWW